MSFEIAVQTAVFTKLNGDAPLKAAITGVFDDVKQGTEYPYVVIGEDNHANVDTDDVLGNQVAIVIHTWARANDKSGRKETKIIQGLIYDALHRATLTYAGFNFISITQVNSESFLDADGHTRHGVQTFNLLIDKG